jgi:hypothetical protein
LSQEALNVILWWKENRAEQNGKDVRPENISVYLETMLQVFDSFCWNHS